MKRQAQNLAEMTPEQRAAYQAYWDEWGPKMRENNGKWLPGQPRPPFSAGHPRKGLRERRAKLRNYIMELEKYDLFTADPVEILIYMAALGKDPLDWRKKKEDQASIPLDMRIDCAKAAGPFVRPKLTSTEISGKEGGAIKLETADLDVMAKDPKVREAFETVTAQLAEHVLEHAQEHEEAALDEFDDE